MNITVGQISILMQVLGGILNSFKAFPDEIHEESSYKHWVENKLVNNFCRIRVSQIRPKSILFKHFEIREFLFWLCLFALAFQWVEDSVLFHQDLWVLIGGFDREIFDNMGLGLRLLWLSGSLVFCLGRLGVGRFGLFGFDFRKWLLEIEHRQWRVARFLNHMIHVKGQYVYVTVLYHIKKLVWTFDLWIIFLLLAFHVVSIALWTIFILLILLWSFLWLCAFLIICVIFFRETRIIGWLESETIELR